MMTSAQWRAHFKHLDAMGMSYDEDIAMRLMYPFRRIVRQVPIEFAIARDPETQVLERMLHTGD